MEKPPIVFQLPDTGEWAVGVVRTVHPTKGAADKAANKTKSQSNGAPLSKGWLIDGWRDAKRDDCPDAPDYLTVCWNETTYTLKFFGNKNEFVAVCNETKTFGTGKTWVEAMNVWLTDNMSGVI